MTETAAIEAVPVLRTRFRTNPAEHGESVKLKDAVRAMHVSDGFAKLAGARLERLTRSASEGQPGYAVVITGLSGSGKSHIVDRYCAQEMFQPFEADPEEGITTPLVYVQAPSPCTLITLGREIYSKLTGQTLRSGLREHDIWERVRAQLRGQAVSVLVIDEMHHVLIGRSQEEHRKVAETLKNVLQSKDWPVHMVLAGMPALKTFCERHAQLRRRCRFTTIAPVKNDQTGRKQIEKYLLLIQGKLPSPLKADFLKGDLPERFRLASSGLLGRVAMFVKLAALLAVDRRQGEVTAEHLASEYEDLFECGDRRNPFKVADLRGFKPSQMKEDDSKLTLLRGTKTVAEDQDEHA